MKIELSNFRPVPAPPSNRRRLPIWAVRIWAVVLAAAALAPAAAKGPPAGPGSLRFTQASFNLAEGAGEAIITVRRHQGSQGAVSVSYETADGSATAPDDYAATSGVLSWGDGDTSERSFAVLLVDDSENEGLETVVLRLFDAIGGASLDKQPTTASLKILPSDRGGGDGEDDEEETIPEGGLLRFDQRTYQTHEGAGVAVVTVARTHGSVGEASVAFTTADGSAVAPDDYETTAGTLEWEDGDDGLQTFTVPLVDDTSQEPTEKIIVLLSAPSGAALDEDFDEAAIIVHDNDRRGAKPPSQGVIGFTGVELQVVEGDTHALVAVERRLGKQGVVSVDFETFDGSATDGDDYEAVVTTLTWARGDHRTKTVRVPILADDTEEGTETVALMLSNVGGGALLDPERADATLLILDDDASATSCAPGDDTLCLQDGRFAVTLVWRNGAGQSGQAHASPLSDRAGTFWFFEPDNAEMLVKILKACGSGGKGAFWVFAAGITDLDFTLEVTDTATGLTKAYTNMLGRSALPVQDTATFTCRP